MPIRYQRNSAAETAPLDRGVVVLEPKSRKFCALNQTSNLIWSSLEWPTSAEQLAELLAERFEGVTPSEALRDVQAIIEEMISVGIVLPLDSEAI